MLMGASSTLNICPGQYSTDLTDVLQSLYSAANAVGICPSALATTNNAQPWDPWGLQSNTWASQSNNQWNTGNTNTWTPTNTWGSQQTWGQDSNTGANVQNWNTNSWNSGQWGFRKKRQAEATCSTFYFFCLQATGDQTCA